jgi:hypothetical protein
MEKEKKMTWLELMVVLDKMPRHLLKDNVELWHYDNDGNYETLPVDGIVSPISDGGGYEDWGPDGDAYLSLQSFDEERKPKLNEYTVKILRTCDVSIMAENPEQAQRIGEEIAAKGAGWLYEQVQEAMQGCSDEFYGVGAAQDYCDLKMSPDECKRILREIDEAES